MKSLSQRIVFACLLSGLGGTAIAQAAVSAQHERSDLRSANVANDLNSHSVCVQETGSRIPRVRQTSSDTLRSVDCVTSSPGRSYSRNDIESTGEVDIGQALRKLDPSIH